ncbi:MAG: tandem-95 repeat protein, partial [Spirochaetales bacterium]|nr:tandem-95 repeat protein [Spirochaetales bacterium]
YNGNDSFTYTVSDGKGGTDTATVTVTVNAVNDAPVAANDTATTSEDTAVTIDVRANDTDMDGDTLSISSVGTPSNGTAAINAGRIVYTPDANYNGNDSFTYTVSDGKGGTDTATVTVTVNAVNDAPVAADDSASTNEDTAVTIDVLANDTDIDGDTLSIASAGNPANGTAAVNAGKIVYTPDANYNGTDSFTYTVSDGHGGTDTATVTVTINAVNDAPVAANDTATTSEDTAVTINVRANDTDIDGDTLSIASAGNPANGTAAINAGRIVYTPDANYNGSDSFTYTVSDGKGGTDTATVNITIDAVNDPPVAGDDNVETGEDMMITIDILANDTDIDGDTLSIAGIGQPEHGTTVINGNSVDYTPEADYYGTDTFVYGVFDGTMAATGTVTITVISINDPPVAVEDNVVMDEDTTVTIDVLANDYDIDGGTLSLAGITEPQNGTAVIIGDRVEYTPNQDYFGTDSFFYGVDDGQGRTSTGAVTITINDVPDIPGAGEVSVLPVESYVNEGDLFTVEIHINSGEQKIASYGIDITYDSAILAVDTETDSDGVSRGPDGFIAAVNPKTPGLLKISGFDTSGSGPGQDLNFLTVYWKAIGTGTSLIHPIVNTLTDELTNKVGNPIGIDGSAIVEPTAEPTPVPGAGEVRVEPAYQEVPWSWDPVTTEIHINSGTQLLSDYEIVFTYDPGLLYMDTPTGDNGVVAGADGFITSVDISTDGVLKVSGYDAAGKGPGDNLHVFSVVWITQFMGTASVDIEITRLLDETGAVIGTPVPIDGEINIY